jgi:hypothetical protein
MRVYIGWDWRDDTAYRVAARSLKRHASVPVEIVPLVESEIRKAGIFRRTYHTRHDPETNTLQKIDDIDGKPFSTEFSFTRFAVPLLEGMGSGSDWVLFTDPDVLWRADIAELIAAIDPDAAVCCVKHRHDPVETHKMDGVLQTRYPRKNWSSVMAIQPDRCPRMTVELLNTAKGSYLHALGWVDDRMIGSLPEEWNWLAGHSSPAIDPKLVHFTEGTPDMEGHGAQPCADEWRSYLEDHRAAHAA